MDFTAELRNLTPRINTQEKNNVDRPSNASHGIQKEKKKR
jgi:hypothetical protein